MSNYELTMIAPTIRPENLLRYVEHVERSFSGSVEFIFAGPYSLPESLISRKNISFIQDRGTPVRCSQRASRQAKGEYLCISADDMFFYENAIDEAFAILDQYGRSEKTIITGKYYEGKKRHPRHLTTSYYRVNNSPATRSTYIPKKWKILNVPFIKTDYYHYLGGQNANIFEGQAMSMTDLANRAQYDNAMVILTKFIMAHIEQDLRKGGDHDVIYDSQVNRDQPAYRIKFSNPRWSDEIRIDPDNWKLEPDTWARFEVD